MCRAWEIIKEVYESLINSKSGISFCEEYKEHNLKSNVHGKPKIKIEDFVDRKVMRFMGKGSAYNYIAMDEAVKDSGLKPNEISHEQTGMVMGSGGPSIENVILAADKTREKIPKKWDHSLFQERWRALPLLLWQFRLKSKG